MTNKKLSIQQLFQILDKDKNHSLSYEELAAGTKEYLTREEAKNLFVAIDQDQSRDISIYELVNEMQVLNSAYVFAQVKTVLISQK
jgi:Ca2+-binding EF-hand superfamily protein